MKKRILKKDAANIQIHCKDCNDILTKKEDDFGLGRCFACIHYEVQGMNRITDNEEE